MKYIMSKPIPIKKKKKRVVSSLIGIKKKKKLKKTLKKMKYLKWTMMNYHLM